MPRDRGQQKHDDPKPMEHSKSSSKRDVYSNTLLPQETVSNKQPNLTPKKQKPQVSRRKEIIMIRAEINEIDKENNRKDQ